MSNALVNGLAGATGGIIAQIITYPLQTVNTRQQTERTAKKILNDTDKTKDNAGGTLFQIIRVIETEGWGGLYSGLKPSLFGTAASQGIYYYFYQLFKNKAEAIAAARKKKGLGDGTVGMFTWLVVAAFAGSVNVLLTNPIWVLVTRMQTHTQAERKIIEAKKDAALRELLDTNSTDLESKMAELDLIKPHPYGTFHAIQEVYKEAGIKGFWKGLVPTLIMSRLQANQEIGKNVTMRYTGTLDAILKMIRYEGLPGFYKGMGTKIVQSVFAASVLFMVKEELVKTFLLLTEHRKILK